MSRMITETMVFEKLKTVMDPELHIDIVSLGLIYDVTVKQMANSIEQIKVTMTLTTPGCPLAPVIDKLIKQALAPLNATKVTLEMVWEPAWTKAMMSEEAKLELGIV